MDTPPVSKQSPFPTSATGASPRRLGVPGEDWPRLGHWTDLMIAAAEGISPESEAALVEMATYFLDLVAVILAPAMDFFTPPPS